MPFTRTNERVFLRAALAIAPQAAEGSPVSDFIAASGHTVWARRIVATEGQQFESFQGSTGAIFEHTGGFINTFKLPTIEVEFYPTPTVLKEMLRSFAGPFSGTSVTWPLNIDKFYSFLYAEAEDGNAAMFAYRFEDAWIHELEIETGGFRVAVGRARIVAQKVTKLALNAVGLTFPAVPSNFVQFAHGASFLIKDPAGSNIQLAVSNVRLNMKHGFDHQPFNTTDGYVTKQGLLEVTGELQSRLMDENSVIRDDALALTLRHYRLRLISGANEAQFNLNNVAWSPTDLGFGDRRALDFNQAFRVGSSNLPSQNSIDITITP